jgi:predicted GTPase
MNPIKTIIMGAAGRDFHNFNMCYRNDPLTKVVAFTATQIPKIEGRVYPAELAGELYPEGIPIKPESELEELAKKEGVTRIVFAYSDVSHEFVMHQASRAHSVGADFVLLGPERTMLKSTKPVIAVCATRTGCGKSQTSRKVTEILSKLGKKVGVLRHPMPYGNLVQQKVQRFATIKDLDIHECTVEEREEYEPYVANGFIIYAGVDYEAILRAAESESDIILWDGGNNDLSFIKPDLEMVVCDPHRVGHEMKYHPGETNLRRATIAIINKADSATPDSIETLKDNIKAVNQDATIIVADSEIFVDEPEKIKNKKVLIIEDGPTLTHGEMSFGAGHVAATRYEASEMVDPRPYAVGSIKEVLTKFSHLGKLVPAMGYFPEQLKDLERTINDIPCDTVIIATPIDLSSIIDIKHPYVRVQYDLAERGSPNMQSVLNDFVEKNK